MRFLRWAIGTALVLYLAGYLILRSMSVDGERIPIAQAIRLSIVRRDVERIARAEHAYMATNDDCLSLRDLADEPDSDNILSGRFGYTYSISCDDAEFSVTATHPPAPEDSHLRFPNYVAHPDLLIQEIK
ncbi:MAG TPA: hypothetical protein VOA78_02360 [Candidatus Dormibacteraeota bacterium]|nr:hypothetical protein [Candidatus Dormibacteraeota bacterium]